GCLAPRVPVGGGVRGPRLPGARGAGTRRAVGDPAEGGAGGAAMTMRTLWGIPPTAAVVLVFVPVARPVPQQPAAADPPPGAARPVPTDPNHLWNRLRAPLHVRVESEFALRPAP